MSDERFDGPNRLISGGRPERGGCQRHWCAWLHNIKRPCGNTNPSPSFQVVLQKIEGWQWTRSDSGESRMRTALKLWDRSDTGGRSKNSTPKIVSSPACCMHYRAKLEASVDRMMFAWVSWLQSLDSLWWSSSVFWSLRKWVGFDSSDLRFQNSCWHFVG